MQSQVPRLTSVLGLSMPHHAGHTISSFPLDVNAFFPSFFLKTQQTSASNQLILHALCELTGAPPLPRTQFFPYKPSPHLNPDLKFLKCKALSVLKPNAITESQACQTSTDFIDPFKKSTCSFL